MVMLGFIFSNSLKTGEESSQQSSAMVEVVQEVAAVIAPHSAIATATGAAYDQLHELVRAFAHFAEFALFGALLFWCVASYTWKKEGLLFALAGVFVVPVIDENLQRFAANREAELCDVVVDIVGGISGALFAIVVLIIIVCVEERCRNKRKNVTAKAQ
jgi:VanZ family protein